jgi:hypothetical protein
LKTSTTYSLKPTRASQSKKRKICKLLKERNFSRFTKSRNLKKTMEIKSKKAVTSDLRRRILTSN